MVNEPKPPAALQAPGRRLWRDVWREAAELGLELTVLERNWLLQAAKLTDRVVQLEAAMAEDPLWVKGSVGQRTSNPMLAEIRQTHLLISQLTARIKFQADDAAADANADLIKINPHRKGAHRRWRGESS